MALQEEFEEQGVFLFKYRGSLPIIILLAGFAVFAFLFDLGLQETAQRVKCAADGVQKECTRGRTRPRRAT